MSRGETDGMSETHRDSRPLSIGGYECDGQKNVTCAGVCSTGGCDCRSSGRLGMLCPVDFEPRGRVAPFAAVETSRSPRFDVSAIFIFVSPTLFCVLFPSSPPLQRKKTVGAVHAPKASVEKKAERPVAPSRDPITLDDLGSWTWDFRASEAATPPVSCGGPAAPKSGGGDASDRIGGGRGRRGRGRAEDGKGGCNAVVTYNVESLVLYLLESGDFQVRLQVQVPQHRKRAE